MDRRGSDDARRDQERTEGESGTRSRQIHVDPLICRYWELGANSNSTPVHLWIFEQKSAIP